MTASHRSDPLAPGPRSGGPPGIDWTQAAPECATCWRTWLAGDLPSGPLLSRRTHAALAAATLALSSTAPAAVLASEPHHRGSHPALHDSNPVDPVVEAPGDDSGSAPVDADPEPSTPDPDIPDPETTPAPEPVAQEPVGAPAEPDDPVDSASDPLPTEDAGPAPGTPDKPPDGGSAPPPPTADQSGTSDTAPVSGFRPERSQSRRHTVYLARSSSSHRSGRLNSPARTIAPAPPQTITRVVAAGAATAIPRAGRARPSDRSHVVRPGESLWSIASDLLGGRASGARIAAEVQHLWQLNAKHIGTGDPDVLPVGTELRLG
jgi:hypothetical protein